MSKFFSHQHTRRRHLRFRLNFMVIQYRRRYTAHLLLGIADIGRHYDHNCELQHDF
jgi:hypothetical protein